MEGSHAEPRNFYLINPALEPLADCSAVVGGLTLPLHSQVLAQQSAVLRELFLSHSEGGLACEGGPDLSACFEGHSPAAVACLLRMMYWPQDACPANFAALAAAGRLLPVAALAHKLDVARPLAALQIYLEGISAFSDTGVGGLLVALQLSQLCKFEAVEARCLDSLAGKLAAASAGEKERCQAIWEAALQALDAPTLARLLCKTLAACSPEFWVAGTPDLREGSQTRPEGGSRPSERSMSSESSGDVQLMGPNSLEPALSLGGAAFAHAANAATAAAAAAATANALPPGVREVRHGSGGSFTWEVAGFSTLLQQLQAQQQYAEVEWVASPWVRLAGLDWRMVAYPAGAGAGKDTHLSIFLELNHATAPPAARSAAAGILSCSITALAQPPAAEPAATGAAREEGAAAGGAAGPAEAGPAQHQAEQQHAGQAQPPAHHTVSMDAPAVLGEGWWGFQQFLPLPLLYSLDRHFLAGDRLLLRVDLAVGGPAAALMAQQ